MRTPNPKLDEEQVREIREAYLEGFTPTMLAVDYGVSIDTIVRVIRYQTWKHVAPEMAEAVLQAFKENKVSLPRIYPAKLNEESVREIRVRRKKGETLESLAKDFGVDTSTIGRIARGDTWKCVK